MKTGIRWCLLVHSSNQEVLSNISGSKSNTWLSEYILVSLDFLFRSNFIIVKEIYVNIIFLIISGPSLRRKFSKTSQVHFEPSQTYKMELFVKSVNDWKLGNNIIWQVYEIIWPDKIHFLRDFAKCYITQTVAHTHVSIKFLSYKESV